MSMSKKAITDFVTPVDVQQPAPAPAPLGYPKNDDTKAAFEHGFNLGKHGQHPAPAPSDLAKQVAQASEGVVAKVAHFTSNGHPFTDNGEGQCARCLDNSAKPKDTKVSDPNLDQDVKPAWFSGWRQCGYCGVVVHKSILESKNAHPVSCRRFSNPTPRITITPEQLWDIMAETFGTGWIARHLDYTKAAARLNDFFGGNKNGK